MATGGGEGVLSDECFDVNCTVCAKKNRIKEAQHYCTDCRKNLCNDCVEIHNDYNEGHTVVDGHGDDAEMNLLTEKCEKHKDRLIELFCVGHDALVCSICALLEHRKCDDLKHITDHIDDLNKDQKVNEVPEQLKATLQNVDRVISALEQHIEELPQREHKFLWEVEEYTKRLLAKLKTLQQNARKKVTANHEKAVSEVKEKIAVCATTKTNIIKCMDDMVSAGNRKAHLFILKKKGQSVAKNVETLCSESENIMKKVKFMFKPDWRIEDTLNRFTYLVTDREKYMLSLKVDIDASLKDDSQSLNISGCCLLPDGTVLLADSFNNKVKHVDPSNCTIKGHYDLADGVCGITYLSPHEVAVCTGGTSVHIISLGNELTCTSTIQLNHDCTTITHSNGELFTTYTSEEEMSVVYVHDLTGTLLRTICENESGENMFSVVMDIVLNQTGERVYVADVDLGLICIDRAGQKVFSLSREELDVMGIVGLCLDHRGNVLMCDFWSNTVVQVAEDGRIIGTILSEADGIASPGCLCYDEEKRRLYVGGEVAALQVYQLV